MRHICIAIAVIALLTVTSIATEWTAASASRDAVNTVVQAGTTVDGDTVLIPNGTATWTSGISTTKQIIIRAANYTATPAGTTGPPDYTVRTGATTRNVTITNNSSSPLFDLTTGNNFHVGIGGIRFNEGTGDGAMIAVTGSGTKPPLIFDCYFQNSVRQFPEDRILMISCRGGVMWNCVMQGTQDVNEVGEGSMLLNITAGTNNWETASTMGSADTGGNVNFYVEDSTINNCGNFPDIDNHGRFVARNFIYDGSWGETHGFTSTWGGRHWEFYDGMFRITSASRNIAGRYFWGRMGTGIFTGLSVTDPPDPSTYGSPNLLHAGDIVAPGDSEAPIVSSPYNHVEQQPGWGHNGSGHVVDPIYVWNNTGSQAYEVFIEDTNADWNDIVQLNREVFVNNGAKPGYTRYTYPHPMRSAVDGSTEPEPVNITVQTLNVTTLSIAP